MIQRVFARKLSRLALSTSRRLAVAGKSNEAVILALRKINTCLVLRTVKSISRSRRRVELNKRLNVETGWRPCYRII